MCCEENKNYNSFLPGIGAIADVVTGGGFSKIAEQILGPVKQLFGSIFGGNYQTTTGPRWLAAWYKHYILGQQCESPTKCVGDSDVPAAQAAFTLMTGVPIYDRYRFAALQGWDVDNDRSLNNSDAQRAQNYLALGPDTQDVPMKYVEQAVQIAKRYQHHVPVGSWGKIAEPAPSMAPQVTRYLPSGTGNLPGSEASPNPGYSGSGSTDKPQWVTYAMWGGIILLVIIIIILIVKSASKKS